MRLTKTVLTGPTTALIILATCWASAVTYGQTAKLYWIDNGQSIDRRGVWRANLDGTDQEQLTALVPALHFVAMAIDRPRAKIYWSAVNGVLRADLDGSNVEEVPFPVEFTCGLAIDSLNRKLYLVGGNNFLAGVPELWRANLDGSALERLPNEPNICFLAMDQVMRRVYFWGAPASGEGGGILSANLDDPGFTPSPAAGFPSAPPMSLALDTLNRRAYWIESRRGDSRRPPTISRILRAGVDGGNTEIVVGDTFGGIISITIAPTRGLLFWAQIDGIHRSALDGSAPTQIVARDVHGRITGLAVWTPPGDFDGDDDVDLADFLSLARCFSGAGEGLPDDPICVEADLDFDRDIDLADLVAFQAHFTGAR